MSNSKEIRTKIASVGNTQKITKAMEMVAGSKMRKSQQRMHAVKPYAKKCLEVASNLTESNPEYKHPYLEEREIKSVGLIVVTSDRGLCGGLNSNLFRKLLKDIKGWQDTGVHVKYALIGNKSISFFKLLGGDIESAVSNLGDTPEISDILGVVQSMLQAYENNELDAIYIASNKFVNNITQEPNVNLLIPLKSSTIEEGSTQKYWDYLYEPDAEQVLNLLLQRYVEALSFNAVIENIACEQSARMLAMRNASDNANEMIADLQLVYNKARQAAITQELSEIVSGAAAV